MGGAPGLEVLPECLAKNYGYMLVPIDDFAIPTKQTLSQFAKDVISGTARRSRA